jgi:hypothetical protein
MKIELVQCHRTDELSSIIESLGAGNSEMMALKGIFANVRIYDVPGPKAKLLKRYYNDVGAEAAIGSDAYYDKEGAVTDIIAMGSLYQHREVRRALSDDLSIKPLLKEIEQLLNSEFQI